MEFFVDMSALAHEMSSWGLSHDFRAFSTYTMAIKLSIARSLEGKKHFEVLST